MIRSKAIFSILILLAMSSQSVSAQQYIFYLHGMIVENQGADAESPYFGAYRYYDILDTFRKAGFTVMSEVRKPNTDIKEYAGIVATQINRLLKKGIEPQNVTVIGASKGALIAMEVSSVLQNKAMNFVFLAACNDGNFQHFPNLTYYGNILSIFEKSDDIGGSCISFKERSGTNINHYKEIEINTGLQHGFLFRPLPEWTLPSINWANGMYD